MEKININNTDNKTVMLNLPHKSVCCKSGKCLCVKGIASSVHLNPGMNKNISAAVLFSPDYNPKILKGIKIPEVKKIDIKIKVEDEKGVGARSKASSRVKGKAKSKSKKNRSNK